MGLGVSSHMKLGDNARQYEANTWMDDGWRINGWTDGWTGRGMEQKIWTEGKGYIYIRLEDRISCPPF